LKLSGIINKSQDQPNTFYIRVKQNLRQKSCVPAPDVPFLHSTCCFGAVWLIFDSLCSVNPFTVQK